MNDNEYKEQLRLMLIDALDDMRKIKFMHKELNMIAAKQKAIEIRIETIQSELKKLEERVGEANERVRIN